MTASAGRSIFAGLIGLVLLAGCASLGANAWDLEAPRVQEAVRGAVNDAMDAGTFKDPNWKTGRLDPATVAAMHTTLDRRLQEHMTGPALAAWQRALHEAIDRDSDGEHVVVTAVGAEQFEFEAVEVSGDAATAAGRARVWVTWVIHKEGVQGERLSPDE